MEAHIFYFHQILLNPKITLAVYGGPEFTRTQDQLALNLLGLVIDIPVSKRGDAAAGTAGWLSAFGAERITNGRAARGTGGERADPARGAGSGV